MGKERGMEWWRLISLRTATPSLPCSPVLSHSILSLLLFSRNIWVGGRDRECEKVTVSDDRVRGRMTEEGADLKTFDVISDFHLVNWSSLCVESADEGNIPAGLPAGGRTGATPQRQQGASFRRSEQLQVWMLMKPQSSSRLQPFHPRHQSHFCYSGRRHCHN